MRAFGMCSVLVTASLVWLVTSGCAAPSATSAPAATAPQGSTGYRAHGTLTSCGNGQLLPLLLRWTGGGWQPTPPPANDVNIFGLAVLSSTSAWAVGYVHARTTLILHWNGTKWS
jgi:hypothetical protein